MKSGGVSSRLIAGLALIVSGAGLLLLTTGVISLGALAFPVLLVAVGFVFLFRSFHPGRGPANIFFGTAVGLTGLLLLVRETVIPDLELSRIWPLYMCIGGISMVSYGIKSRGLRSTSFVVPGLVIILLSVVFLLFSLDVIEASLSVIAVQWWPLLIVIVGVAMLWPVKKNNRANRRS